MEEDIAIKVDGVYKDFRLPHEKVNSLKNVFTNSLSYIRKRRTFETQHALKDINLEIKKGEFFGIVGRNGSGKSTLLKILAGIYQPTKGKVTVNGKLVPFIELGVGFSPDLTGRENVYLNGALLGFSRKEIDEQYQEIVDFAELEDFMDQKLKNYSSGMQVRLAFSMAVRAKADILLIDEVLAVGDADFQRKCFDYFKSLKRLHVTVIFVSHDMNSIREFCDRSMLIDENKVKSIGSTPKIANQYSQLFINEDNIGQIEQTKSFGERWGLGDVRVTGADVKISRDNIVVAIRAKVHKNVSTLIYGIHINEQDGREIVAMNNRMINRPSVENLKSGQEIELSWKILNIFSDGNYSVTLTFVDGTANTLDWVTEAARFEIKRIERSTTSIFPPISVEYKVRDAHE